MAGGAEFRWPNGAGMALSLVVNVEEGSEMSVARGDRGPEPVDELGVALKAEVRAHGNESNYRYGLGPGARRVFGALRAAGLRATVTAAAQSLEVAPEVARMVVAGGHEPCAHGWRWVHQFRMDEAAERAFIARAVSSLSATTGQRPLGWLSRYLHTDSTRRLLAEAGFLYHMDDYSDDLPFWDVVETAAGPRAMVIVPYALDTNDMKFWLAPSYTPGQWLDYAIETFERLRAEGRHGPCLMSLGLHLRIIGRPGRIGALERFLAHAAAAAGVWVATRAEIARAFAAAVPAPVPAAAA
jgi:peptidoglycan/xylan/chitin deacetylase (PgdA/CDA1 family)